MKWRVSTTEAEARPHPAPTADAKSVQTAPAQRPAGSPAAYGLIFFRGKPMSNMGEKHKGRGKVGKLSVVPILWESQAETDVSTPHLRGLAPKTGDYYTFSTEFSTPPAQNPVENGRGKILHRV